MTTFGDGSQYLSVRQRLVDAVAERMRKIYRDGTVTIAATGRVHTFATTFPADQVFVWRKTEMRENGIVIRDHSADTKVDDMVEFGKHEHRLTITIEAYLLEKTVTAPVSRQALADVMAALGEDHKWGGLARYTEILGHQIGVEQSGNIVGGGSVDVAITYRTGWFEM